MLNPGSVEVAEEVFCLKAALDFLVPEKMEAEGLVEVSVLDKGLVLTHENFTWPGTWTPSMGKKFSHFLIVVTSEWMASG